MTTVTGKLETITGSPSRAAGVWVRATYSGPTAVGMMTEEQEPADYDPATGVVSFTATAGTSGVLVVQLHGRSASFPIIIPEKETATLREVVENAHEYPPVVVAEGVASLKEVRDRVLNEVSGAVPGAVQARDDALAAAGRAEADATRAESAASTAITGVADGAVTRRKLGPDVVQELESKVSSVNGQTGTVVLDAAKVGAAPTTHTHTSAQITDKREGVWSGSTDDGRLIATSGGGYIQTSKYPTMQDHVPNKKYVDDRAPAVVRQEVQGTNGVATFEKRGNVVHVISTGTDGGVTIPVGFRPAQARKVATPGGGASSNEVGICTLNTNGSINGGWSAGSAFSYLIQ